MKQRYNICHRKLCLIIASLLIATCAWAQNKTVSGIVRDQQGETLLGVTVAIEGTTTGTITDLDGSYSLQLTNNAKNLSFSFMGMKTVTVEIGQKSVINPIMESTAVGIDEVVVVAYGTQKKVTITGAVSSIKSDEILASPSASAANALAGKVTGLTSVQYSGQPGADDAQLMVRGVGSLSEGSSSPLIMVDGVERSFSQLDPNEIEDITVLKDASATAVYGIRGGNGVILVTTKRGQKGKAKITASTSFGVQAPVRLPEYADSYTYASTFNAAQISDGMSPDEVRFDEKTVEAFRTNSDPILYPNTDWMDYMIKDFSTMAKANVNIAGGTDRVRYFASFGYLNQEGMLEEFDTGTGENFAFQRFNYRTNIDLDVTNKTQLQISLGGRNELKNEPATSSISEIWRQLYRNAVPFTSPGIVDGKYIQKNAEYINSDAQDPLSYYYGSGYNNQSNSVMNFDLTLRQDLGMITKGLKFRAKGSYNTNSIQVKSRGASADIYTAYYAKDFDSSLDEDDKSIVTPLISRKTVPKYSESYQKGRNWYMEAALTYNRKFNDHEVSGLLLYNQRKTYYPSSFWYIPQGYVGSAARLTYNYKTKYLVELNAGYNGSENFHEDSRYGLFPAASLGWVISEESFVKDNLPFIQYLKLRASCGLVGNDVSSSRFLYLPDAYTKGHAYNYGVDVSGNQAGYIESKIGNPDVTWETALKQNYGFDLSLLDKKLTINADYFIDKRKDILTTQNTVGTITGLDASLLPMANIGKVNNRGFEISVKWKQKINNLEYWISPNITHNSNEIIYKDEIPQNEEYLYRTGGLVGQPFGYVCEGFYSANDFNTDGSLKDGYAKPALAVQPGDAKYTDLNGDGSIDDNDIKAIGYPNYPLTIAGLNTGVKYKGFDVSMQWVGATQTSRNISESLRSPFGETMTFSLLQRHVDESWTPETAETATQPRITFANRVHNRDKNSTLWLMDASYIRLKSAEIGYTFKGRALRKIGAERLRVCVNGYNLLTFDKMDGVVDPETNTSNRPSYPVMKIYNIGATVNF